MLKVVFNEDGSIKELIVMESINQGSNNVNKVFASVLGRSNEDYTCVGEFELPSGDLEELSGVADSQQVGVNTYNGYTISLAESVTRQAGNLKLNLKLIDLQDNVLCTYQVTLKVNKTGYEPNTTHITEAQYNALLQSFNSIFINGIRFKYFPLFSELPTKGQLSTIYLVDSTHSEEENVYDEYVWNPTDESYDFIGLFYNSLDLSDYYTKEEVDNLLESLNINKLESIKDSDGNLRFREGEITPVTISGVSFDYAKWSLSGTHLLIVLGGTITNGSSINSYSKIADIDIPSYVGTKIYPLWANEYVAIQTVLFLASDWTSQNSQFVLRKRNDGLLQIESVAGITANSNKSFRIAFDLLIDND